MSKAFDLENAAQRQMREYRRMDEIMRGDATLRRLADEERRMRAMIDPVGARGIVEAQRHIADATGTLGGGSIADKAMRDAVKGSLTDRAVREAVEGGIVDKVIREAAGHVERIKRDTFGADMTARAQTLTEPGTASAAATRDAARIGELVDRTAGTARHAPPRVRDGTPDTVTERRHAATVQVHAPGEPIATPAALGARIKAARRDMGMTQQSFADLAGVGRRFLSEVEAGKPGAEFGKVLACCAAAGIDLFARKR